MPRFPSPAAAGVAALASAIALGAPGAVAAPAKTVSFRAVDFKFVGLPKTITPGRHTFSVVNRGQAMHNFKLAGKKTRLLATGQKATLTVQLKRGRYAYLCTVPGHAQLGMRGTIVVK
ncbi:MAG: plastocyanin/azurin family copper-binding protein [Pseudomonadota bacterium]